MNATAGSADGAHGGSNPNGAMQQGTVLQDEDSEEERANLALDTKAQRDNKAKAKVKRTREDQKAEELDKLDKEVLGLVDSLTQFPRQPNGMSIGRVDRMLAKKAKDLKAENDFQNLEKVDRLSKKVELLRCCVKTGGAVLSGNAATRKKNKSEFVQKFDQLEQEQPDIFNKFPVSVKRAYIEHVMPKLLEEQDWDRVASTLSLDFMETLHGSDNALPESVTIIEAMMGQIFAKHEKPDSEADAAAQAAAAELATALEAAAHTQEAPISARGC